MVQNTIGHALELDKFRDALERFRLGVSEIWTHKHRYCRGESEQADMNCPFCVDELEYKCLFLFRCKKYHVLRSSNLNNVERGCQPSILSRLFNDESCSANCIKKLAWFISKAFDKRHKCMQGTNADA